MVLDATIFFKEKNINRERGLMRGGYCLLKRTHEVFLDYVNFFLLNDIAMAHIQWGLLLEEKGFFLSIYCGCGIKSTYNAIDFLK